MNEPKTCKTCKWWEAWQAGKGDCSNPKMGVHYSVAGSDGVYLSACCSDSGLTTGQDFGCIYHEAKEGGDES
jgi:hypothetical protein